MGWTTLWGWLRDKSAILQAIAATIFILLMLAAVPAYLKRLLRPELILQVDEEWGTSPPDLYEWADRTGRWIRFASSTYSDYDLGSVPWSKIEGCPVSSHDSSLAFRIGVIHHRWEELWSNVRESDSSPVAERLRRYSARGLGVLKLELRNESDHAIPGIRLRVDHVYNLWDVQIAGDFLTEQETNRLRQQVGSLQADSLVLPELPTLPANAGLSIAIYGHGGRSEPAVSVTGARCETVPLSKVEDTGIINWYLHPFKLFLPAFLLFWGSALAIPWAALRVHHKMTRRVTPGILYDLARRRAKDGRDDEAMLLLREAFEGGYSDKTRAAEDPDLQSLHGRDDFKRLTSS
jgi:hypothetical protein